MVKNGKNWPKWSKWSEMVQNGSKWSKLVKNGEKWSKLPKLVKIAKKWSKWPKMEFRFLLKEDGCLCSKAFNLIQIFCASQFESLEEPLQSA